METVKYQFFVFLYTIYGGIIIGISYDIYRVMKGKSRREKIITSIWDLVFLIIVMFICAWAIFSSNYGDRRVYLIIGLLFGFILYEKVLGKFAIFLFTAVKKSTIRFFAIVNNIFAYPFKLLYNLLWHPISKMIRGIKKLFKLPGVFLKDTKKYYKLIIKKRIKKK